MCNGCSSSIAREKVNEFTPIIRCVGPFVSSRPEGGGRLFCSGCWCPSCNPEKSEAAGEGEVVSKAAPSESFIRRFAWGEETHPVLAVTSGRRLALIFLARVGPRVGWAVHII